MEVNDTNEMFHCDRRMAELQMTKSLVEAAPTDVYAKSVYFRQLSGAASIDDFRKGVVAVQIRQNPLIHQSFDGLKSGIDGVVLLREPAIRTARQIPDTL